VSVTNVRVYVSNNNNIEKTTNELLNKLNILNYFFHLEISNIRVFAANTVAFEVADN